jgi:hypothetical protein
VHETGFISDVLEAYERLILDSMRGDRTLFTTAEGIERLWEVSMPLRDAPPPVQPYPPGAWDQNPSISSSPSCLAAAVRARLARSQPSGQLTRSLSTAIEFEIPFEY